jgi:hypothetical protein
MVLVVVCLVSLLGLVSLVVPEPTKISFTSPQPETATASYSSTEQLSPILTSSTNQMITTALAVVLIVSLLTVVRGLRKKEAK